MGHQITPTPIFEGESLKRLQDYIKRPMNEKEKEISKRINEKRRVPVFRQSS